MKPSKKVLIGAASLLLTFSTCLGVGSTPIPAKSVAIVHPALLKEVGRQGEATVSVIASVKPGFVDNVVDESTRLGVNVTARWDFINAFAAQVSADQLQALAALPSVTLITPEQSITASSTSLVDTGNLVNAYNSAVQVEQVWQQGYNGNGVTVAVVDTGITPGTEMTVSYSHSFNSDATTAEDRYGHGTHVAGIIAGNGNASSGKYIGIAPGVNLLNVKYSTDNGIAREQDLVSSLQWIYDNRVLYNIRIVNISSTVNTPQSYKESAVAAAVEQLWMNGVVVVVSAGNKGTQSCSTCYAPANDPMVISVGAADDNGTASLSDDSLKSWSSNGQTMDGLSKPEIVAPGAEITSYMPTGSLRDSGSVVDSHYFRMGGTSMAAPVVSGVVALMLQKNPQWTPDQVKWVLMNTTRPYVNQRSGYNGIVQAPQAVFYTGTPGTANQGVAPSPFLSPSTGTINYDNMSWSNMSWSNMSWSNNPSY